MNNISLIVFLLSLLALPVGLIKPSWVVRREGVTRRKFGIITLLIIIASFISYGATSTPSTSALQGAQTSPPSTGVSSETTTMTPVVIVPSSALPSPKPTLKPTIAPSSGLSNDNTYVNSVGNTVHSPTYSNTVPAGASAICGDGTYSFSQSRRGTCSHHGGVSQWL